MSITSWYHLHSNQSKEKEGNRLNELTKGQGRPQTSNLKSTSLSCIFISGTISYVSVTTPFGFSGRVIFTFGASPSKRGQKLLPLVRQLTG